MAEFMRRCKGKVMVCINDHPDIRQVFEGYHFKTVGIRYRAANQRQGRSEVSGELVIASWEPAALGGLFWRSPSADGRCAIDFDSSVAVWRVEDLFNQMKVVSSSRISCSAPAVLAPHWIVAGNKN